ncbi:ATP12 family chaperone protein [Lentibacter sp. XHP0401]|uniref:ATP12 family chaperone protein n=1 Tax=Lentibacter sp. XHP0401 TaxID=2984334 RepID=UPI0021E7A34E|nr:ATP12 family protein [Lentibacter sp. XHP0401]MCV2894702.1 ATPase [Lentibacter sp. XHP0401]
MSEWKLKRFWSDVSIKPEADGYSVVLDGRVVKTPAKATLVLPNEALAQKVADEWAAVKEEIKPADMPYTRSANAALDKVAVQHAEVAGLIAAYAETDLLCYRADSPAELQARQAEAWGVPIKWADETHGMPFRIATGVMPVSQPEETLQRALEISQKMDSFALTGFHDLVSLTGSFVLGLMAAEGHGVPENLWNISRIDETWQVEQWGVDDEAAELAETKRTQFLHAYNFFHLSAAGKS